MECYRGVIKIYVPEGGCPALFEALAHVGIAKDDESYRAVVEQGGTLMLTERDAVNGFAFDLENVDGDRELPDGIDYDQEHEAHHEWSAGETWVRGGQSQDRTCDQEGVVLTPGEFDEIMTKAGSDADAVAALRSHFKWPPPSYPVPERTFEHDE